jgi:AcrR family transcriptional regulator
MSVTRSPICAHGLVLVRMAAVTNDDVRPTPSYVSLLSTTDAPRVRSDAARNSLLLLEIARSLIDDLGAEAVTMDAIATAAGVGKGTLFRRFGNRAGLFMTLLDEDEMAAQRDFLYGPPPLGPGAPPLHRLLAFGRARLHFVQSHLPLLLSASRDPQIFDTGAARLHRTHIRVLFERAGTNGNLEVQTDALMGLLDPSYVAHKLRAGETLTTMGHAWNEVALKLCGT